MANWLNAQLKAVGVTTQLTDIGTQEIEGKTLPLPPVVLGKIGDDKNKKTILVYGHFDVQPVSGWKVPYSAIIVQQLYRLSRVTAGTRNRSRWSKTRPLVV